MSSKSSFRRRSLCALAGSAVVGIAIACGVEFPTSLLERRADILDELAPMDWLSTEIEELIPPATDALLAREDIKDVAIVERQDIEDTQMVHLAAMRSSKSGNAAYDVGKGLPQAIRLYVAGAVEFKAARQTSNAGADTAESLTTALSYFAKVLELPDSEKSLRATWASYMAGRALSKNPQNFEEASRHFQLTRELARKGMPDTLGLAVASYGEEARLHLNRGSVTSALELYLDQAARGSVSARNSLRIIAQRLLDDPELAIKHIGDPRIQRLWSAAALADGPQGPNINQTDDPEESEPDTEIDEKSTDRPKESWVSRVTKVSAAIDEARGARFDQLSALAYQTGRFDIAATLAARSDTAIAAVVRAKLALRDNNRELAAREYARAVGARHQARRVGDHRVSEGAWGRLLAENGVLAVSRGEYAPALESFIEAGSAYWMDSAYVAERVMTLDELAAFAEQHPIAPRVPALDLGKSKPGADESDFGLVPVRDSREALQLLLARRQLREKRYDQALASFDQTSSMLMANEAEKPISDVAREYVAGIRQGANRWTSVGRAESLMAAAKIAKMFGMEVLGYELSPDFAVVGGNFTFEPAELTDDFINDDEKSRITASQPPKQTRFHYRNVAIDLALSAADLVPPRSQSFAAILCRSLQWAKSLGDDDRAESIYERYVREGAYVGWSEKFGVHCEEPDFDRAADFVWKQRLASAHATLRPYKIHFVVGSVLIAALAALAALATLAMRRRSAARPP